MNNAELIAKIKAEIENWLKEYAEDSQFELGERHGYKRVLKFLSTLEESEKPIEGLEEEITRTYHEGSVADTTEMDHVDYENIARHFAQCGAEHARSKIMKDAVEGRVILRDMYDNRAKDIDFTIDDNLKIGDDVRIIVVKE